MRKVKKDFTGFTFTYPIDSFYVDDGDTIECVLDLGFRNTKKVSVRLNGVFAPDTRSVDPLEVKAAMSVKHSVIGWLKANAASLACTSISMDKIEGRILGSIHSYRSKDSLSSYLLTSDMALPFNGTGPKPVFSQQHLARIVSRRSQEEAELCRTFLASVFMRGGSLGNVLSVASGETVDSRDIAFTLSLDRGYVVYHGDGDDLEITEKGRKLILGQ